MSEWASPYFTRAEFACKGEDCCGGSYDSVDYELLQILTYIRERFDRPVIVTSGHRCPAHNMAVGSNSNSQHLHGRAADIVIDGVEPALVAEAAEQCEAGGIGIYDTFVHIDTRTGHARW